MKKIEQLSEVNFAQTLRDEPDNTRFQKDDWVVIQDDADLRSKDDLGITFNLSDQKPELREFLCSSTRGIPSKDVRPIRFIWSQPDDIRNEFVL